MAGDDLPGMHYVGRYDVYVPDGTHLAPSRDSEDGYRGSTLDDETNIIAGQGILYETEDKADDEGDGLTPEERRARTLIGVAAAVVAAGATAVWFKAEDIKGWWDGKAAPTLKSKWRRLRGKDEPDVEAEEAEAVAVPIDISARRAAAARRKADAEAS